MDDAEVVARSGPWSSGLWKMFAAPGVAAALAPVATGRAELVKRTLCPQTVQPGLAGRPETSRSLFVLFEDRAWGGSFEIQQHASYFMFTFTRSCCWVRCFRLGKVLSHFCKITSGVVAFS